MDIADLLTTTQAAERRGVSVRTIHRAVADGRLEPAAKIPGSTGTYLFDPAVVDRVVFHLVVPTTGTTDE